MNIQYLSVLTTVNNNSKTDYTLVKSQNDNFKNFIMDDVNFKRADINKDDFLTYSELSNIKLSPQYNVEKNIFKLKKGFDLLSTNSIEKILDASGLSLKLLEESLKELDKNRDNTITTNEINPDFTKIIDKQKSDYRAFKMQKIDKASSENAKNASDNKQIEALNKQIESLKRVLRSLKTQQLTTPTTPNKNDVKDIIATGINKKVTIDGLKNKYGSDDTNKLVSTILKVPNATKHIANVIYQSGTKASEKEVTQLAGLMASTTLNKIAVEQMSDMNAIEQISPANTPINIDEKNIDFTRSNIEQKIQDLEGMKTEIIQKQLEKTTEDIFH